MSWRNELLPASFRGATFHVERHDSEVGGRRVHLHQYPGRDEPYAEDLGIDASRYTIDAYVIGDAYMAARDALIAACNKEGPGRLVHPYLGELTVLCPKVRLREERTEGRMARLSLEFVQAGENRFPQGDADRVAATTASAVAADTAVDRAFSVLWNVARQPNFVSDAAASNLAGIARQLADALADLALVGAAVPGESLAAIEPLRAPSATLVADPAAVSGGLRGVLEPLLTADRASRSVVGLALDLATAGGGSWEPVVGSTPARLAQAGNQTALRSLLRRAAVTAAARAAAGADWETYDDALGARDRLAAALDDERDLAADRGERDAFTALGSLRAATVRAIEAKAPGLPRLVFETPRVTEASLVTAYRLYGDVDQAETIARRNGAIHLGFLPAGEPLEVLARTGDQRAR
ncbi:MAG: DNA circularization N-terminal domain-containing protein [Tistlia sp.]|uniref:DNA circularization protein n=1 Tax=Tistlia sp. TaxID=3057121 RepID=UPI0034A45989